MLLPVSYTHLDVYKRQVLKRARQMSIDLKRSLFDKELMVIYEELAKEMEFVINWCRNRGMWCPVIW